MSSSDNEDENSPLTPEQARIEAYFNELFALVANEDWDRLLCRLQEASTVLTLPESFRPSVNEVIIGRGK